MAIVMQASGIPGVDMGAASIKMNEDGSFNLLVGATDIGTGSDTMFCQVAAETLGVPVEKIIPYSSDTDMTPFDPGAYASSTTYISGRAVQKAALEVKRQIAMVGASLLEEKPEDVNLHGGKVCARDGRHVTYEQVCLSSLYQRDQFQIMATASHMSYDSPPPFAAVFVEVEVDVETGVVRLVDFLSVGDVGVVVNPRSLTAQLNGGCCLGIAHALYQRLVYDPHYGLSLARRFYNNRPLTILDVPHTMPAVALGIPDPETPVGARGVGEPPVGAGYGAVMNAIADAIGVDAFRRAPVTSDVVLMSLTHGKRMHPPLRAHV